MISTFHLSDENSTRYAQLSEALNIEDDESVSEESDPAEAGGDEAEAVDKEEEVEVPDTEEESEKKSEHTEL